MQVLYRNAALLLGGETVRREGSEVLVEGGEIREVSDKPIRAPNARPVDLGGRTLMPGLIDCHVHVIASMLNLGANAALPDEIALLRALPIMKRMLLRGFTTVRDAGGADYALAQAVEQGLAVGPRLFVPGKALSQTGGHGDMRARFDDRDPQRFDRRVGALARIADGVDAVRRAAREELRRGAHQVKIMANGGVASPTDPIAWIGYSREEVLAAVEEARNSQTYVMAHLYTAEAIRRAAELGVRSLEHCNLIDRPTAHYVAGVGAFAVPTLVTYQALHEEGARLGLPPDSVAKIDSVRLAGLRSLEIMRAAGVKMAFGTDLLGESHERQSDEFRIRAEVLPAHEVIASATTVAAELLNQTGRLGTVAPGAIADLIVVDGDPLDDIGLLTGQGEHIPAIMKAGQFVKNELN